MSIVVLLICGVLSTVGVLGYAYTIASKASGDSGQAEKALKGELSSKERLKEKFSATYSQMIDVGQAREKIKDTQAVQESLKAERGRITITQAELETVETRLRELEEIERELEASGLETKEELNILEKKHKELNSKNNQLKSQIEVSAAQWDQLIKEMETNSAVAEKIMAVKNELILSEEKVATLMLQIEQGNDQYFILKKRYDALDIEYAQLYEKFSEAEAAVSGGKKEE